MVSFRSKLGQCFLHIRDPSRGERESESEWQDIDLRRRLMDALVF